MKVTSLLNIATRIAARPTKAFAKKNKYYLGMGVVGAAVGGKRGDEGSAMSWLTADPQTRKNYEKAYGRKAYVVYRKKNIISGTVSGFIDGYAAAAFIGEGTKHRFGQIVVKNRVKANRNAPKFIRNIAATSAKHYRKNIRINTKPTGKFKSFMKNWVLPAAVDTGLIYGASNAYGEFRKHQLRAGNPKRESNLTVKDPSWILPKVSRLRSR